jgi:hypothetical protein
VPIIAPVRVRRPASRCTLARVTVNGELQGVYTLLEEVDDHFLARRFRDPSGNTYEGSLSDFRADLVDSYSKETNKKDPDRSDLSAVMEALNQPDETLAGALEPLIDLDAFYRYWAAETLVWHRDGYSGNVNNHYLHANRDKGGRFVFIPWGIDSVFNGNSSLGVPDSVMAFSVLTSRLYFIDAQRDRYYAALDDLLAKAWDPAALLMRADQIGKAVEPHLTAAQVTARRSSAAAAATVITGRGEHLHAGARRQADPLRQGRRALRPAHERRHALGDAAPHPDRRHGGGGHARRAPLHARHRIPGSGVVGSHRRRRGPAHLLAAPRLLVRGAGHLGDPGGDAAQPLPRRWDAVLLRGLA